MRKVSLLLIVAIAAAASLAQPVLAQDKAAEVLAAMRQAIGAGKLDSLRTFSLEAATARNIGERQLTTEVELYLDLPDKYLRVDNVTAPIARTMTSGFNGDKVILPAGGAMGGGMPMVFASSSGGGAVGGGGGMTITTRIDGARGGGAGATGEMTPEQRAMMEASVIRSQRVELSRLMLGWFGTAHPALKATYTYAGEAESPDGKAHVISIKADGGFDAKLFIDQATNIPLMLTYEAPEPRVVTRTAGAPAGAPVVAGGGGMRGGAGAAAPPPPPPPPGGAQQMTQEEIQKQIEAMRNQPRKMIEHRVYFGDWKEVDGIQFPHSLQRATGETTTEEWTISKVKVNPKIDAKKFQ